MSRENRSNAKVRLNKIAAGITTSHMTVTYHGSHGRKLEVMVDDIAKKRKRWREQVRRNMAAAKAEVQA